MLEHEAADLLTMNALGLNCGGAGANQVPHRLVALVGNPHRSQLAGPKEPG